MSNARIGFSFGVFLERIPFCAGNAALQSPFHYHWKMRLSMPRLSELMRRTQAVELFGGSIAAMSKE